MDKTQKTQVVEELGQVFSESGVVVIAHYTGLSVAEMSDLRGRMREGGASVRVAKNTLSKIAIKGAPCEGISDLFKGQTVMAYSEDPVAAAKIAVSYAKDNQKLVILGGAMGETVLNPDGVKALADMPSLDELRAKLIGVLKAPATKVARVAQAPAIKLAMVLKAYAEKDKEDAA